LVEDQVESSLITILIDVQFLDGGKAGAFLHIKKDVLFVDVILAHGRLPSGKNNERMLILSEPSAKYIHAIAVPPRFTGGNGISARALCV